MVAMDINHYANEKNWYFMSIFRWENGVYLHVYLKFYHLRYHITNNYGKIREHTTISLFYAS